MVVRSLDVHPDCGIHMRPAGLIAQCAREFDANISIETSDGLSANAKSILEISALGTCSGKQVRVVSEDEAAANAVYHYLVNACVELETPCCA